ncbi:MAG: hypothetical protein JXA60_12200 [Candidatus Coatesbacteria bacterium]|nr:hypothetical protein [Candidatus Coatesbacteria bacterium]
MYYLIICKKGEENYFLWRREKEWVYLHKTRQEMGKTKLKEIYDIDLSNKDHLLTTYIKLYKLKEGYDEPEELLDCGRYISMNICLQFLELFK